MEPSEHKLSVNDKASVRERLDYKVDAGCWVWNKALGSDGYARMSVEGRTWLAHRASYAVHVGDLPPDVFLDHLCRNRACINPEHLDLVTKHTNWERGKQPGARVAKTGRCASGEHEMTEENTITRPSRPQHRECRACARERQREYQREWRRKRREA